MGRGAGQAQSGRRRVDAVRERGERPAIELGPDHRSQAQVACLSLAGRLLVFPLDELKLQSNGGRGLTLIDLDAKDALVSVTAFGSTLQVLGTGRGGKPKDELLRPAALAAYVGKRARKGRVQDVMQKAMRVLGAA